MRFNGVIFLVILCRSVTGTGSTYALRAGDALYLFMSSLTKVSLFHGTSSTPILIFIVLLFAAVYTTCTKIKPSVLVVGHIINHQCNLEIITIHNHHQSKPNDIRFEKILLSFCHFCTFEFILIR